KGSHETFHLLAFAGFLTRARCDAAEGTCDGEGVARPAQGRSVRGRLSEAQPRRRGPALDRRRGAAAGAVARDPRVSRGEISATAAVAERPACAGAHPRACTDGWG